jgi:hypothetical protein
MATRQQIHLKLPLMLYRRLKRFAQDDRRSVQNAVVLLLERALEERDEEVT